MESRARRFRIRSSESFIGSVVASERKIHGLGARRAKTASLLPSNLVRENLRVQCLHEEITESIGDNNPISLPFSAWMRSSVAQHSSDCLISRNPEHP